MIASILATFLLATLPNTVVAQDADTEPSLILEYTRELMETLKKQVEWAKFTTDQLSTMMGPRIGTHFTEMSGYCAGGVSVTSHWNLTTTDCLYECLSADECAGFNFYVMLDRSGSTRCEMVTVNIFSSIFIQANCTMFIRRWRNSQFGTLFSGSRIASITTHYLNAPTMYECVGLCKKDDRCMHVSYRQPDQSCTLHATGGGATIEDFAWLAFGRVVRCPDFYIRFQRWCIRVIKTNESWVRAQANCRAENAYLVNVQSHEKNSFLRELIQRESPHIGWWIGAREISGDWMWDGLVESDEPINFHYWTDRPSNADNAKCAYFAVGQQWDRTECDGSTELDMFYYICETPASQLHHPMIISM